MLNLLPKEQKNALKKEYLERLVIVWLGAVISGLIISLALLAPSFVLTRIRAASAKGELEAIKKNLDGELPSKETLAEFETAVKYAEVLKPSAKSPSVYELIKIFESKPQEIKIDNISFSEAKTGKSTISLGGFAENRESLTSFARTLEGRIEFDKVDLPISNFVKEKDIDFSMTILLK